VMLHAHIHACPRTSGVGPSHVGTAHSGYSEGMSTHRLETGRSMQRARGLGEEKKKNCSHGSPPQNLSFPASVAQPLRHSSTPVLLGSEKAVGMGARLSVAMRIADWARSLPKPRPPRNSNKHGKISGRKNVERGTQATANAAF